MREPLRVVVQQALDRARQPSSPSLTGAAPNRLERLAAEAVRASRVAAALHCALTAEGIGSAAGPIAIAAAPGAEVSS